MSPQTQSASHKKKCGVKPSPSAIKATENKTPNGGKNAANMSPDNNKSVVELQRFINLARKQSVGAKSVEKSPANNTKPVVTTPKNQNKPSHTKPQSNKSSSSISEEELDRIFPGAKKERESPEASIGRLLYDTFDQVSKASGAKGLEASRWASPSASTQSSRPVIEKSESPNYQNNKSRTPSRRNNKMNSSNNTSASSSPSPRGRTGHPASRRTTKTSGHTVAPIINTPETIVAVKESARVGKILFDAFNDLGKTSTRAGLEASRWAVISDDKAQKNNAHVNKAPIVTTNKPIPTNNAWSQNVNIDNTSAFLAALKARSAPVSKQADTSLVENKKDVASKSPIREHNSKLLTICVML